MALDKMNFSKEKEDYTLSAGQTRFNAMNKPVGTGGVIQTDFGDEIESISQAEYGNSFSLLTQEQKQSVLKKKAEKGKDGVLSRNRAAREMQVRQYQ